MAEATIGHAGPKHIVWIGRGFPPIDLDGLTSSSRDAFGTNWPTALACCAIRELLSTRSIRSGFSAEPPAQDLADFYLDAPIRRPGRLRQSWTAPPVDVALHGRNDVDHMIDEIVRNGESFYMLAYRPSTEIQDAKPFRRIRIVMKGLGAPRLHARRLLLDRTADRSHVYRLGPSIRRTCSSI